MLHGQASVVDEEANRSGADEVAGRTVAPEGDRAANLGRDQDGRTSESAAAAVGVSSAVGTRCFRHRRGMATFLSVPIFGRYVSFAEREVIAAGVGLSARPMSRNDSPSRKRSHNSMRRRSYVL